MREEIPRIILFDYGHTLVHETKVSQIDGQRALMPYVRRNDRGYTAEQISTAADQLFSSLAPVRKLGYEFHNHMFQQLLYESLGIELSITMGEAETIFWDHFAPGEAMPYAAELLSFLKEKGIRTGVVSNISFSGTALRKRLERIFPGHPFEMVIATSEYLFRKPNRKIFELAAAKAGLSSGRIWYCGDSAYFDVNGSAEAGMVPVWYHSEKVCHYRENIPQTEPVGDHISIGDWRELMELLKKRDRNEK